MDLAHIHDRAFSAFARGAAPALIDLLQRAGIQAGRVLLEAGCRVWGVDRSCATLRPARRRPGPPVAGLPYFSVRPPRGSAVTSLGECLNCAFEARAGAGLSTLFSAGFTERSLREVSSFSM